ncbi:LysR family transcriptional regulator [Parasulfitobacter algicola]|uniref:LysR family transcriptional regulator n=1 Tax=Parasulfitobacter algicola TaxID=2614809 RepID=A0ABX2IME9_9RHOB|nr:LysR family transcriptional regulator [Sulfitobacter algicola]NSX54049.1 LysR family transcriptional regulator [Sulfitobacter algicola]
MASLNYNHLRYFWAVAHDGNLTRTAEKLNLSQSALSVQIRKLEDRLGHPLFERRGRQLHLTEAGRIALDHADTIFAVGDELLGTLNETGRARNALRVGALATLSRNFQLQFLRPLLGRNDIELDLKSGSLTELLMALKALQIDVVLTNQATDSDGTTSFISHKLSEQQVSLIGTPSRFDKPRKLQHMLATHPILVPTKNSALRRDFDALTDRLGIRPIIAAEVDDMAMLRLLTRQDIGLAVLPPIVVQDELKSGELVEIAPLDGMSESFYAITLDRRFPNPTLKDLLS